MNCRFRFLITASACALLLSANTGRPANTYVESFSTTTYKDTVNTTANWDTTTGELKLFPFEPSIVGSYDTPGEAQGIVVEGDLAFVADGWQDLRIFDISDPTNPIQIGFANLANVTYWGMDVEGDLLYVPNGNTDVRISDISNPASPTHVGTAFGVSDVLAVAVAGDLACAADRSAGLRVIDVSDPTFPLVVGTYNTSGDAYHVTFGPRLRGDEEDGPDQIAFVCAADCSWLPFAPATISSAGLTSPIGAAIDAPSNTVRAKSKAREQIKSIFRRCWNRPRVTTLAILEPPPAKGGGSDDGSNLLSYWRRRESNPCSTSTLTR